MYDMYKGPNSSVVLEVAVPGFKKEELTVKLLGNQLDIIGTRKTPERSSPTRVTAKYASGIPKEIHDTFYLSYMCKVDRVDLNNGILSILISKDLGNSEKIEING